MKRFDTDFSAKIKNNLQGYRGNLERFGSQLEMPLKGNVIPPTPLIPSDPVVPTMAMPVHAPGEARTFKFTWLSSLKYTTDYIWASSSVKIGETLAAVVYSSNVDSKWHITTMSIDDDGEQAVVDSGSWIGAISTNPTDICYKSGTNIFVTACGIAGVDKALFAQSHIINASTGAITTLNYDSLNLWDGVEVRNSSICHVAGDVFVAAFGNMTDSDGWAYGFTCDDSGNLASVDSYEFDGNQADHVHVRRISDSIVAILWKDGSANLRIITLSVDGSGNLGDSPLSSVTLVSGIDEWPRMCHLRGNIYVVTYSDGTYTGYAGTFAIDPDTGAIGSLIESLQFETTAYEGRYCYPTRIHDGLLFIGHDNGNGRATVTAVSVGLSGDNLTIVDNIVFASGGYALNSRVFFMKYVVTKSRDLYIDIIENYSITFEAR